MSTFELIVLTLSIIVGLSMGHLLWAVMAAVRGRRKIKPHWLPLTWVSLVLLAQVQFWFAAHYVDGTIDHWTWSWYLWLLFLALLLFSSSALLLPTEAQRTSASLLDDFTIDGHLGLLPLAAYFWLWIPTNAVLDGAWLQSGNIANVLIASGATAGYFSRRPRVAYIAAVLSLCVFLWAMLFSWAPLTPVR